MRLAPALRLWVFSLPLASAGLAGDLKLPRLLMLDLELSGDLGGPTFQAEHDARLKKESDYLRAQLVESHRYQLIDAKDSEELERLKQQYRYLHDCNGCDLPVGRELGADQVLVAWVDRVSALILTLTYEVHDTQSGQILSRKSYDFRGDNDDSWSHAIRFMVRDLGRPQG